ncbi:hypothetical protein SUGI_0242920 [Cryptomeria japonica]|nr:hypothetical protein SUGI_0242920 [Cryptomeria japonica]
MERSIFVLKDIEDSLKNNLDEIVSFIKYLVNMTKALIEKHLSGLRTVLNRRERTTPEVGAGPPKWDFDRAHRKTWMTESACGLTGLETQLYCCTHKVPVCGDCIWFPEHSACEVRTYAEWMVDSSCSFLPKCSFCLQILTHSRRSGTQLGCLYVLHNWCLLLLLKGSSSPTGYKCPSCKSQIWPTKKQFVSSGSSLANQLEELFAKSHIFMLDKNSLLPLASELLSNFSEQGFSQPRSEIRSTVFSLSSHLAEMYTDPKSQKAQQSYIPKDQNGPECKS